MKMEQNMIMLATIEMVIIKMVLIGKGYIEMEQNMMKMVMMKSIRKPEALSQNLTL